MFNSMKDIKSGTNTHLTHEDFEESMQITTELTLTLRDYLSKIGVKYLNDDPPWRKKIIE